VGKQELLTAGETLPFLEVRGPPFLKSKQRDWNREVLSCERANQKTPQTATNGCEKRRKKEISSGAAEKVAERHAINILVKGGGRDARRSHKCRAEREPAEREGNEGRTRKRGRIGENCFHRSEKKDRRFPAEKAATGRTLSRTSWKTFRGGVPFQRCGRTNG